MGRSSWDISAALMGVRPESQIEEASCLKDKIFYRIIPEVLEPMDGAADTLDGLKSRGYRISIASSNPTNVMTRSLKAVGLNGRPDSITSQDEVEVGKPAPDLLLRAAEKLDVESTECLGVGDTCYDIRAARAAGMTSAGFSGGCQDESELGEAKPDLLIRDLRELLTILPGPPRRI
jgi:HAD superfamily hydrolase (TIGR01509 family)